VACAILVAKGLSVDDAIHAIRNRRKGMIRNPAQIIYLRRFESRWKGEHEQADPSSSSSDDDIEAADPIRRMYHKERKHNGLARVVLLRVIEAKDLSMEMDL
jgi:hypothetical protein